MWAFNRTLLPASTSASADLPPQPPSPQPPSPQPQAPNPPSGLVLDSGSSSGSSSSVGVAGSTVVSPGGEAGPTLGVAEMIAGAVDSSSGSSSSPSSSSGSSNSSGSSSSDTSNSTSSGSGRRRLLQAAQPPPQPPQPPYRPWLQLMDVELTLPAVELGVIRDLARANRTATRVPAEALALFRELLASAQVRRGGVAGMFGKAVQDALGGGRLVKRSVVK